jgi:hypothetical protein
VSGEAAWIIGGAVLLGLILLAMALQPHKEVLVIDERADPPVNSAPAEVRRILETENYLEQLYARGANLALALSDLENTQGDLSSATKPGMWKPEEKGEADPPPYFVYDNGKIARKGTVVYNEILASLGRR